MESNKELMDGLKEIAKKYEYDHADLTYAPLADPKIQWTRTTDKITFNLADYFKDLPTKLQLELINRTFCMIRGYEVPPASKELNEILGSKEFREMNVDTYIIRNPDSKPISEYKNVCFKNRLRELVEEGYVTQEQLDKLTFRITKNDPPRIRDPDSPRTALVKSSMIFKVVWIDKRLDKKHIPNYVIRYLLLKGIMPALMDYTLDLNEEKTEEIRNRIRRYSRYVDALSWLTKHNEIN